MIRVRVAAACLAAVAAPALAGQPVTLPVGTVVPLVTTTPLSSKVNVKGDMVPLRTARDVVIDGRVAIPADTEAVGQIADARAKGAMGMSGKLTLRPLYLEIGGRVVRLTGAAVEKGEVDPGAVVGMVLLTPGFTGRSATIPAGTPVAAMVEKAVAVESAPRD
jgi:hypothetical protein